MVVFAPFCCPHADPDAGRYCGRRHGPECLEDGACVWVLGCVILVVVVVPTAAAAVVFIVAVRCMWCVWRVWALVRARARAAVRACGVRSCACAHTHCRRSLPLVRRVTHT